MKNDEKSLNEIAKREEVELDNPDDILLYSEPVFLINKAPTSKHLAYAQERGVPVVVVLSLDKFDNMPERMMWQAMNIPDLPFVCTDWAGDHSNVPFIKNKWRDAVKERHDAIRAEMARKYAHATGKPAPAGLGAPAGLPPVLQDIFNQLRKKRDDEQDDGGFIMAFGPPPE